MAVLQINRLSTAHLRGDIFGGVTAAIIALPLALAFGVASGVGPIAGLYGAICVGLFAALFGGTSAQISGPTGPMTVVAASVFTQFASEPAIAFTVVMMAGGFQILFGYLNVGRYINLVPYPVISGFMTGIGCILIILQLEPLMGHTYAPNVVNALTALPDDIAHVNLAALTIGLLSFGLCIGVPRRIGRVVPAPLIALVSATLFGLLLGNAPILGEIPSGLPDWQAPAFDYTKLSYMLVSAAILAALGSIDSLLTSLVTDNISRSFHDSDRELVGQGIGNIVAGFAGGLPGAGATVRTLANFKAGGRTPLSGVLHAVVLFTIALGLGPVVGLVPHAALAGILLKVAIDVIDWRFIKRWYRMPRSDLLLMIVVLALTVFVDVITAVGVGIVMASLVFVKEMADIQVQSIRTIVEDAGHDLLTASEAELFQRCNGRIAILHLSGAMSFGAANEMMRRIVSVKPVDILIIDLTDVPDIDGSAALTLEEIMQRAIAASQDVLVVGMQFRVARMLGRIGALDEFKDTSRYPNRLDALTAATAILNVRDAATP